MTIQELEKLIALYGKDIYSFCRHLTNNQDSADDLYQDTFLEALKKLDDISVDDNPKAYLLSIAVRIWKNKIRKIAWRKRIAPTCTDDGLSEMIASNDEGIENSVLAQEEREQLWKVIDGLSDNLRLPIMLYYMEEQPVEKVAEILSLPQGTVKSRLHNARKAIKKEMEAIL